MSNSCHVVKLECSKIWFIWLIRGVEEDRRKSGSKPAGLFYLFFFFLQVMMMKGGVVDIKTKRRTSWPWKVSLFTGALLGEMEREGQIERERASGNIFLDFGNDRGEKQIKPMRWSEKEGYEACRWIREINFIITQLTENQVWYTGRCGNKAIQAQWKKQEFFCVQYLLNQRRNSWRRNTPITNKQNK